jgi:hypothetical protein
LAEIYRHYLGNVLPEIDFTRLGAVSYGRTGADVERFARGGRRRARRERRAVQFADVFSEIAGELPPPGDRSLWSTAIHEGKHPASTAGCCCETCLAFGYVGSRGCVTSVASLVSRCTSSRMMRVVTSFRYCVSALFSS